MEIPTLETERLRLVAEKLGATFERQSELHGMAVRVYVHALGA